jgi:hypothetical protein
MLDTVMAVTIGRTFNIGLDFLPGSQNISVAERAIRSRALSLSKVGMPCLIVSESSSLGRDFICLEDGTDPQRPPIWVAIWTSSEDDQNLVKALTAIRDYLVRE